LQARLPAAPPDVRRGRQFLVEPTRRRDGVIGSDVVDVVIGILFVFLVFSLVVSGVNEFITWLLDWRSRHLWRAIRQLLDGDDTRVAADPRPTGAQPTSLKWAEKLHAHPLILQLEGQLSSTRSKLANIPSSDFSRAVIDLLVPGVDGQVSAEQVQRALQDLPDGPLKDSLLPLVKTAGEHLANVRQEIGQWFDSRMEALSKVYRRQIKWLLMVVGIAVALVFNVDAIGAAQRLYRDDALRTAVATQATAVVAACEGEADVTACTREQVEKVDTAIRLPVGWPDPDGIDWVQPLGWLIAGIALGQGAPFWFDLLRKAGRLRS
jgi:hypothetical protein